MEMNVINPCVRFVLMLLIKLGWNSCQKQKIAKRVKQGQKLTNLVNKRVFNTAIKKIPLPLFLLDNL